MLATRSASRTLVVARARPMVRTNRPIRAFRSQRPVRTHCRLLRVDPRGALRNDRARQVLAGALVGCDAAVPPSSTLEAITGCHLEDDPGTGPGPGSRGRQRPRQLLCAAREARELPCCAGSAQTRSSANDDWEGR
jgi:hypothetical protein